MLHKYVMQPKIFISIASFCDGMLSYTLSRALVQASYPDRLHFGIVDQSTNPRPEPSDVAPARLTVVTIDPVQSKGACWARALAMSLYDGEEYFFQIDSHMDFEQGWDELLIAQSQLLAFTDNNHVISSYPHAFYFVDGAPKYTKTTDKILFHVARRNSQFRPANMSLMFDAYPADRDAAMPGFHLGAGCLFAPGSYVEKFPYDPYFYFHGEEQALSIRLFTHGWTIYHMPALPIYHLYNNHNSTSTPRKLHWDQSFESVRQQHWGALENKSQRRLIKLVNNDKSLGQYALGSVRTVAEYAAFSGIDYANNIILPKAYDVIF